MSAQKREGVASQEEEDHRREEDGKEKGRRRKGHVCCEFQGLLRPMQNGKHGCYLTQDFRDVQAGTSMQAV